MRSPKNRTVITKSGISDFLFISSGVQILPEIRNPHKVNAFHTCREKDTFRKIKVCQLCMSNIPGNPDFFHMWIKCRAKTGL